jgi:hypothetical protein
MLKQESDAIGLLAELTRMDRTASPASLQVASLCGVDEQDHLLVRMSGESSPRPARIGVAVDDALLRQAAGREQQVLLACPPDSAPIVMALLREKLDPASKDGCVRIAAPEQLELRCGRASLVLKGDGRVTVRGTRIVSASSGPHKIKGASVELN